MSKDSDSINPEIYIRAMCGLASPEEVEMVRAYRRAKATRTIRVSEHPRIASAIRPVESSEFRQGDTESRFSKVKRFITKNPNDIRTLKLSFKYASLIFIGLTVLLTLSQSSGFGEPQTGIMSIIFAVAGAAGAALVLPILALILIILGRLLALLLKIITRIFKKS